MVQSTCIACETSHGNNPSVFNFTLPKEETTRIMWLENCNIDPNSNLSPNSRLCMNHFSADDVIGNDKRRALKKNAIPFIHDRPATDIEELSQEQNSGMVNVESDTESIPCEATSNPSDISSSEENVVPESRIDLTIPQTLTSSFQGLRTRCADGLRVAKVFSTVDLNPPKSRLKHSDLKEALKRETVEIRRLRKSNRLIKKQLEDFRKLIDELLRRNLVTPEGRRMIEEFRRRNAESLENQH